MKYTFEELQKAHKDGYEKGVVEGLRMASDYILAIITNITTLEEVAEVEQPESEGVEEDVESEGSDDISSM